MENNSQNNLPMQNDGYKESHGSGIWSTLIFMFFAIAVMFLIRKFLNYWFYKNIKTY